MVIEVESAAIKSFGWDGDSKVLTITFNSGTTYEYRTMTNRVILGLVDQNMTSFGRYFHDEIRGKFPFTRVKG